MKNIIIHLTLLVLCFLASIGQILAHEGEDHGQKQKTNATAAYFSSENSSEKYEVLIKYGTLVPEKDEHLTLFLSDVNTNMPIAGAKIKISNMDDASQTFEVSMKEPGIYEVHTKFSEKKSNKLNISIDAKEGADLIQLSDIETGKELPKVNTDEAEKDSSFGVMNILYLAIALFIGLGIGLFMKKKTRAGKSVISLFLLTLFVFSPSANYPLWAHGGEDHEEDKKKSGNGSSQLIVAKETQFLFDIRTSKLDMRSFSPSVNLFGTVLPTSAGKALVQTPQTGIIRSLNVTVGQMVNKGQLLATIDQNIDANTQVSWQTQKNALEAEMSAAKKEYDRLLAISDIVAKRDIDEAERRYNTSRKNLQAFEGNRSKLVSLYAPIDGKVENFNYSMGSTVNAGQEIMAITNLNMVYVEAQVFDKDIDNVKSGKEYLVECTDNDKHKTKKVRLVTMSPSINPSNQSQRVLFEMDNLEEDFKIGEFVNIRVFKEANSQNITVPNSAITEVNGKSAVFLKDAAEQYSLVYVSTGENNGQFTTILKGVEESERIVINGAYQLKMMYLNQ
ncbi:MAG TPA: efflux RND transporter periplasmic adaptor subunit [Bacteroidia bacterium]